MVIKLQLKMLEVPREEDLLLVRVLDLTHALVLVLVRGLDRIQVEAGLVRVPLEENPSHQERREVQHQNLKLCLSTS